MGAKPQSAQSAVWQERNHRTDPGLLWAHGSTCYSVNSKLETQSEAGALSSPVKMWQPPAPFTYTHRPVTISSLAQLHPCCVASRDRLGCASLAGGHIYVFRM